MKTFRDHMIGSCRLCTPCLHQKQPRQHKFSQSVCYIYIHSIYSFLTIWLCHKHNKDFN